MENTVFQAEMLAIREAVRDYIQIKQADEENVINFLRFPSCAIGSSKNYSNLQTSCLNHRYA